MKTINKAALAIVAFGIAGNLIAQSSINETPGEQGGRYKLIPIINGTYTTPYVIDSQTGRIWREVLDQEHQSVVFVSCNYMNLEGELSKVPNETARDIHFKNTKAQVKTDLQTATKEAAIWQTLLEQAKSGRAIKPLDGWNRQTGEPVYGAEVQPSDKLIKSLQLNIIECQEAIDKNTLLLKQFEPKTP
jgi:hypothetical protein